jgi:hypothetical protein
MYVLRLHVMNWLRSPLRRQLGDVAKANLRALVVGTFGDRSGECVHVAGCAGVDDRDPRHAPTVPRGRGDAGIASVPGARPSTSDPSLPRGRHTPAATRLRARGAD